MSDQKKDDKSRPMFGGGANIRDVLPTEAEGDALLDMLFDDAPRGSSAPPSIPEAASVHEAPAAAATISDVPLEDDDEQATMINLGPDPTAKAPPPPPHAGAKVVSPPGWKIPPPSVKPASEISLSVDDDYGEEDDGQGKRRSRAPTLPSDEELAALAVEDGEEAGLTEVGLLPDVSAMDSLEEIEDHDVGAAVSAIAPTIPRDLPRPPTPGGSSRPRSIPALPPSEAAFEDERDASILLAKDPALQQSFVERANWIRAEAALQAEPSAQARSLLVASELYAMAGEDDEASSVAEQAQKLFSGFPLGLRQHRSLLARSGNWRATLDVMDSEAKVMPTPESKCHVTWFSAEVARCIQGDDLGAKKRSEMAIRAMPGDPRAHVHRFAEALAGSPDTAQLSRLKPTTVGEDTDISAAGLLSEAFARVVSKRGAVKPGEDHDPYESLLAARGALRAGDLSGAVKSLGELTNSSIGSGAGWLGGLLAVSAKETRAAASDLFRIAGNGSHAGLAAKVRASVAIESGGEVDLGAAPEAFTDTDRIGVAALSASETALGALGAIDTSDDSELEALRSLARVVLTARGSERSDLLEYKAADSALVSLARALAEVHSPARYTVGRVPARLRNAVEAAATQGVEAKNLNGLQLELDIDANDFGRVAKTLAADGDPAGLIASGLVSELGKDAESSEIAYGRVLELGLHESILRAIGTNAPSEDVAHALQGFADQLAAGPRKYLVLLEAGIRLAAVDNMADATACLRAATEVEPKLGVAAYIGSRISRTAGDQSALLEWLRSAREGSDDPVEKAHDFTREALLLSDGENNVAGSLLEEALSARPADVGLRDLYERLSHDPPKDRAAWRDARARETTGAEAARLAMEAAIEYEHNGDMAAASRCVGLAEANGDKLFAPISAYRYALHGVGTAEFVDALLPQARETTDPMARLETYERLAELDERGRGDRSSALLFRRMILEENPSHVRTLRRVASALMAQGREEELEPIALELARGQEGPEAHAYAALAARLRSRVKWEESLEPVTIAYAQEPRSVWSLRQMGAFARMNGDDALAALCEQQLMGRTERPAERATLAVRAAESRSSAGDVESAKSLYEQAVAAMPEHPIARIGLAEVLQQLGSHLAAAMHLEAAADAISNKGWKAELDARAGAIFEDQLADVTRARAAFERVFSADPKNDEVFNRLRKIYVAAGARSELAELLERKLESVTDPGERVEMEVMRGRALAEVGDAGMAKRALLAALESNPDHVDALLAFADLSMADEDFEGAEQALIRLARLTSDADGQAAVYMRIGELYDQHLPNPERAEAAYQEILKRKPDDIPAREKLIGLLRRTDNFARAVEEQHLLLESSTTIEAKCQRTIELADILEQMGDLKKAESTLVVSRKSYPKSDLALRALVQFYQRTGQGPSAAVLLDRAVADARRALSTGRFETYLFETLWSAAELRGREDAARVAQATVLALEGDEAGLQGAGAAAGDASLDDLLAPEVMTPAFRELLIKSGPLLDQALPFNTDAIRATPLVGASVLERETLDLADAYGLGDVQMLVSPVLGQICIAASAHPPTVVFGQALSTADQTPVRTFLIHRALKVIQSNAATFARTAPIDLWPLLAAYLKVMNPGFSPQGVDAAKLNEAHTRLTRAAGSNIPADAAAIAADVISSIGNRASTLNNAINGWGARAALLATADPNVALTAIGLASGAIAGPPTDGKERITWVGRNAEARDLIVFSVSDAYSDARARLNLG